MILAQSMNIPEKSNSVSRIKVSVWTNILKNPLIGHLFVLDNLTVMSYPVEGAGDLSQLHVLCVSLHTDRKAPTE